jgi:hypothetical protein
MGRIRTKSNGEFTSVLDYQLAGRSGANVAACSALRTLDNQPTEGCTDVATCSTKLTFETLGLVPSDPICLAVSMEGLAMAHAVDGFALKFLHRGAWKAERREHGKLLDVIPVTWTKGTRANGGEIFQQVWYESTSELEARLADPAPFVVAVAGPKASVTVRLGELPEEDEYEPRSRLAFKDLKCVYEVISTGVRLTDNSIQTRVLRRLRVVRGGDSHA